MQCRLCLGTIKDLKDGVSCAAVPEMGEIVETTLGISMDENRSFPQTVCVKCYQITVEYYAFRTRCVENQKTLKLRNKRKRLTEFFEEVEDSVANEEIEFFNELSTDGEFDEMPQEVQSPPKAPRSSAANLQRMIAECNLRQCRVTLKRLTENDIVELKVGLKQRSFAYSAYRNSTNDYKSHSSPLSDHNYYEKPPEDPSDAVGLNRVVKTYCRAGSSTATTTSGTTTPQMIPHPGNSESPPVFPPRIKVLSSDEINSRASSDAPPKTQDKQLTCMLRLEGGRLEIQLTDEKQNVINFWTISEQQRQNIHNTFKPDRVHQDLAKAFGRMPITKETELKLRHLYRGKIPFLVIVRD